MDTATVVIPTTGRDSLRACIASVLHQTYQHVIAYIVCDGPAFRASVTSILDEFPDARIRALFLPENIGAGGFYGHRAYAGCSHFVNSRFVLFLDEDNWFEPTHVQSLVAKIIADGLQWAYSLRRIHGPGGEFLCEDDCESLGRWAGWQGYHLVDTSSYCLTREVAVAAASAWHGGWGQDRVYFETLHRHFPRFGTTGIASMNYRVGGNEQSVQPQFFLQGNAAMRGRHPTGFPWRKGG